MEFLTKILFFLGAIGVFNSLLVSAYFLIGKTYKTKANSIFGLFLLVLSLRVLKSLFYAFSTEDPIFILQSGPAFFLLIGPLFFSYISTVLDPNTWLAKYWKTHIGLWLLLIVTLMLVFPFSSHITWNKTILLPLANVQLLGYLLVSLFFLKPPLFNYKKASMAEKWLFLITASMFVLWSVYSFTSFDFFVSGSIVFSILFYSFFLYFIFNKKSASQLFKKGKKISGVDSDEISQLKKQLSFLMEEEKLYINANLKSSEVAQQLNISIHDLSRLLNESVGKSFTAYINEYRVEEAKQLIQSNSKYTLEAIGNMSGFNSKSAFYRAFKIHTGGTPAKFKE